jgi:hypothetical protein
MDDVLFFLLVVAWAGGAGIKGLRGRGIQRGLVGLYLGFLFSAGMRRFDHLLFDSFFGVINYRQQSLINK